MFVNRNDIPVILFFTVLLLIGFFISDDYGISWDEPMQRDMGNLCYDYVTKSNSEFFSIQNKYHNSTWEFLNVLPERVLNLKTYKAIYTSRHFSNFLIFWVAGIFFYKLLLEYFQKQHHALLGVLMLFLSPRFFAHSFFNSKDIPLLSFFLISVYLGIRFIKKPQIVNVIFLSILCGMTFGMRILGILLPFLISFFFLVNIFTRNLPVKSIKWLIFYWLLYPVCVYVFVPVLWPDPIFHFKQAFLMHSHFPYSDPVLFMGKYVLPSDLPWYYVPVWIGISTPILWILFFIAGLIAAAYNKTHGLYQFLKNNWIVLFAGVWFFLPWVMILILKSHLYDEWRHLYFTYPAFIFIAVFGLQKFIDFISNYAGKRLQFISQSFIVMIFLWQFVVTFGFMIRNHPHQHVYFNFLAGKSTNVHLKYEMDYWGLSYRKAWEYLLDIHQNESIDVEWQNNPGLFNLLWFNDDQISSINHSDYLSCEYFITNYRWYPTYDNYNDKIYSLMVDGMEIMTIFKNPAYKTSPTVTKKMNQFHIEKLRMNSNLNTLAKKKTGDVFMIYNNGIYKTDSVNYLWYKMGNDNGYDKETSLNVLFNQVSSQYYIFNQNDKNRLEKID